MRGELMHAFVSYRVATEGIFFHSLGGVSPEQKMLKGHLPRDLHQRLDETSCPAARSTVESPRCTSRTPFPRSSSPTASPPKVWSCLHARSARYGLACMHTACRPCLHARSTSCPAASSSVESPRCTSPPETARPDGGAGPAGNGLAERVAAKIRALSTDSKEHQVRPIESSLKFVTQGCSQGATIKGIFTRNQHQIPRHGWGTWLKSAKRLFPFRPEEAKVRFP